MKQLRRQVITGAERRAIRRVSFSAASNEETNAVTFETIRIATELNEVIRWLLLHATERRKDGWN